MHVAETPKLSQVIKSFSNCLPILRWDQVNCEILHPCRRACCPLLNPSMGIGQSPHLGQSPTNLHLSHQLPPSNVATNASPSSLQSSWVYSSLRANIDLTLIALRYCIWPLKFQVGRRKIEHFLSYPTTINSTTTDPCTFVMSYSHVHPMAMNNKINMFYSVL